MSVYTDAACDERIEGDKVVHDEGDLVATILHVAELACSENAGAGASHSEVGPVELEANRNHIRLRLRAEAVAPSSRSRLLRSSTGAP